MATRTTICPRCQEAVPGGRLSCSSCGLLLASVAGATRRRTKRPTSAHAGPGATAPTDPAPTAAPLTAGAYVPPGAMASGAFLLPARAWAGITSAGSQPMAGFGASPRPMATAGTAPTSPSVSSIATARVSSEPRLAEEAAEDPSDAIEASWLEATAGWLMIIGSAVAMLGFLLPWSRSVIGAAGTGTYFDTWGIANPSHVMVVLALAAALGLAILANPIPTWIRTCAVGLSLGGLLVGLTWPYLFGPLGAGPGVLAVGLGGVMLGIAGVLDLIEARHAAPAAGV